MGTLRRVSVSIFKIIVSNFKEANRVLKAFEIA
jgi:hypothetical protein